MRLFAIGEDRPKPRRPRKASRLLDALYEIEEFQEYMKAKKDKEDKEKRLKKPEAVRFSFLETVGLCFILGPWLGVGTLYGIKIMINNMELMLR